MHARALATEDGTSRRAFMQSVGAGVATVGALGAVGSTAKAGEGMAQDSATAKGFGVHNEWGTLREVYVGRMDSAILPTYSPQLDITGPEVCALLKEHGGKPLSAAWPEMAKGGQAGLDRLAQTYERHGVKVHRPREFNPVEVDYLAYLQDGVWQTFPADSVWVVGRHVIECQLRQPLLTKQNFVLREEFLPHVDAHDEARWVQIPATAPVKDALEGNGPYLEGGDILILGKDVLVGVDLDGFSTDELGASWLSRYLADDGFKVWPVPFRNAVKIHLLAHLGVPREGLAIIYKPLFTEGIPEPMKGYDFIEITKDEAALGGACIVAIDSKRCLLPAECPRIADELAKRGVEPVLVPFEDTLWWGGGLRCGTCIIQRDVS